MTKTKGEQAYQESSELKPVWARELEQIAFTIEKHREQMADFIFMLNSTQVEIEKLETRKKKILAERNVPCLELKS